MQTIFQKTLDAHTRYQKPACYNAVFVQPFAFDMRVSREDPTSLNEEPKVYLMHNLYTEQYKSMYPDSPIDSVIGREIVLLNGVEFTTEVATWGDRHETKSNNAGVRFNAAIRSYLYRSAISLNILPMTDLKLTLSDGSEYTFPWIVSYTTGLADVSLCAAQPESANPKQLSSRQRFNDPLQQSDSLDVPHLLVHSSLHDDRPDRTVIVPSGSTYYVSCFVQSVSGDAADASEVSNVLVMKVASFSPPGEYLDAW